MVRLTSIAAVSLSLAAALAVPFELAERDTVVTTSKTGNADGYYYSCYIESGNGATMDIGTSTYKLSWNSGSQDVVAGIGWQTGAAR